MKTIYIYCEGLTEDSFINTVLYPYFFALGIYVRPIVCETRRDANRKYRGGVSRYAKIKSELMILCKSHPHEYVTTMFDYYAMPIDTPGIADATTDIFERINKIESIINEDIGERNCKFHFMLHEFEGILFSKPETFSLIAGDEVVTAVQRIREEFETPEHINNSPETAPSKRLEALIPGYAKIKNGTQLSDAMGIHTIMEQCPHFKRWIQDMAAW